MDSSDSPSKSIGSEPLSPDDAFALLGNETRVDILQVLWDAFESGKGGNVVPYSELFGQVDYDDSGNFSYHLEKLTGPFVRQTDDGYELKQTGINVVRAVVSGTVTDDLALGPTQVDATCPICNAPIEVTYFDEVLDISCTSCEGRSRWNDRAGHLFGAFVPPAGIANRPIGEAFRAAVSYSLHEISAFHDGVCPDCSGEPETTVTACPDHNPGEETLCPTCDQSSVAEVWMVCTTCKRSIPPPVTLLVLDHPDVTTFYRNHGIEHRFATWETVVRSFRIHEQLLSADPLRIRLSISAGEDELRFTLDGDMTVIDVST